MKKTLLFLLLTFSGLQLQAQKSSLWKTISEGETSRLSRVIEHKNTLGEKYYTLNVLQMKLTLASVSDVHSGNAGTIVSIPNLNGDLEQFEIWENSNFDPVLQAQYPEIRAYTGRGVSDKSATINFSLAPIGFQTAVFRIGKEAEFIEAYDKEATVYVLFNSKNSHSGTTTFKCGVVADNLSFESSKNANSNLSSAGQLKTMRLAASCNGEYAQHFGGTVAGALSGINASMTRMNALFERDLAIHLNLIATTDNLIYLNPATDPFSDGAIGAAGQWNYEAQNNLSAVIGNGAYDLGHLFCKTGGGGNAGCLGCVCVDDDIANLTDKNKGGAFTAPESGTAAPAGDVFDYDFLAHEFGHQFGASHSFSYAYEGSGTNVEPGSGCATMGYAGVTNWDVQPHNIIQFATASIVQIQANMGTKTCPVITATSATPTVNAGTNYTIPRGTAFVLTGSGSDADTSDVLSYSWEQNDDATAATEGANSITTDTKTEGPTFRLYNATASPIRYMPKLEYVLNGQLTTPSNWESVSNVARTLHFTCTVRDNHLGAGQTNTAGIEVGVVTTSGPFVVTSQNTSGIIWSVGASKTITWDVNNTTALAGSATVNVLLSTDGGLTFPTVLGSSVPNNGSLTFTVPNVNSLNCRIMIKPTGNIYYAVNSNAFVVQPALLANVTGTNPTINGASDGSVTATPVGGASAFNYSSTNTFTGAPFNSHAIPANTPVTVSTIVIPALPVGSVINSAVLNLNNVEAVNGYYRDEIRVSLTGAYTLAVTQLTTTSGSGIVSPNPAINLPSFPISGGTVNLQFSQTYSDTNAIGATIAGATIAISYTKNGYTYLWSNGATTQTVNALPAGTYSVTVTDASNGTASGSYTLTNPVAPITWTGAVSNLWNVAGNWNPNTVPTGSEDVLIPTGTPSLNTNFTLASGFNLTVNGTGGLIVEPNIVLKIAGTANFNDKSILFRSDATGTGIFGELTGTVTGISNVTVERYIMGRRAFRFLTPGVTTTSFIYENWQNNGVTTAGIGTQITGGATGGFDVSQTNNPSLHTYNAQATLNTTGFTAIPNTNATILSAGVGYRLLVRGDRNVNLNLASANDMNVPTTLSAKGTLKTGTVTFDTSGTSPVAMNNTTNTQTNGYTLIGNPYVSPVDWLSVTKTGVDSNSYYTWDPTLGTNSQRGRYVVYSANTQTSNIYLGGTDAALNRRYLQSGQAVFVKNVTLGTPATVSFAESNKATNIAYVFRSAEQSVSVNGNSSLYLTVYEPNELAVGGAPIDGTLAMFGTNFSDTLDENDVQKLNASGENLAFARENKNLAIETLSPVEVNDELFVKTIQLQSGKNYTFKVNTDNFDTAVSAKMVDLYLNTETPIDLTQPSFVTFSTTSDAASYGSDRFKIVFNSTALGNGSFDSSNISIYPNPIVNNQFTIALPTSVTGKVSVTMSNMLGQIVYSFSQDAVSTMQISPKNQLQEGIYIINITNNGNVVKAKVIVKK